MVIKSDPRTWTDARHRRGVAGEEIAMRFLRLRGWKILGHRFRMGRIEVDVIARRDDLVSFVEVKTRRGQAFGSPLEAVRWQKQREITKVARAWVDRFGSDRLTYRFDVIGVTVTSTGPLIHHVEDAFRAGWR